MRKPWRNGFLPIEPTALHRGREGSHPGGEARSDRPAEVLLVVEVTNKIRRNLQ